VAARRSSCGWLLRKDVRRRRFRYGRAAETGADAALRARTRRRCSLSRRPRADTGASGGGDRRDLRVAVRPVVGEHSRRLSGGKASPGTSRGSAAAARRASCSVGGAARTAANVRRLPEAAPQTRAGRCARSRGRSGRVGAADRVALGQAPRDAVERSSRARRGTARGSRRRTSGASAAAEAASRPRAHGPSRGRRAGVETTRGPRSRLDRAGMENEWYVLGSVSWIPVAPRPCSWKAAQ
jgi:hypothetical protein